MQETLTPISKDARDESACLHCRQPVAVAGERFCCNGCETVYSLLSSCGLGEYYALREQLGTLRAPQPVQAVDASFAYLDDPEQVQPIEDGDSRSLEFYLEGVHCAACVWLVEKLPEFVPGVRSARLNLSSATARVTVAPGTRFDAVATTLARWGYRPHVVGKSATAERHARREQTMMLSRIGVAAFAAGNLMILSVALYSGLSGPLAHYFEWLSLLLAAPAVTFSAWPFYRQAWGQLRHGRRISIDVPIALSLILGTLGGVWELIWGSHQLYFDSLAMLVFLLLFSRYALLRTQQQVLRQDRVMSFYTPEAIEKQNEDGSFVAVPMNQLSPGDLIRVAPGQRLPADGTVVAGVSTLDLSVLTGETFPAAVGPGEPVFCGASNQAGSLTIRITALGGNTRLGGILTRSQANLEEKTRLIRLADKLARRFVWLVLGLSSVLFLIFLAHPQEALVRVLALAIISCPCALALATPLMVQISLKRALAKGFFIRKAESLERLPDLGTIVFDKTGTLTQGRFELLQSEGIEKAEVRRAVRAIEARSAHPVARALVQLLADGSPVAEAEDFETLPAGGVAGKVDGRTWAIRPDRDYRAPADQGGHVMLRLIVSCDEQPVASLLLGDRLRPEAPAVLAELRAAGYDLWLLSGDQPDACTAIAAQVGIATDHVLACQSPEQKEAFFKTHPDAMMVGDGINDMLAMSCAKAGISVQGSAEENLQSADIYLAEQGIAQLPALLRHARLTRRLLKLALSFSFTYNLLGITAAVLGFVTPLFAAVVMPLSALTVMSVAIYGGRRLCKS